MQTAGRSLAPAALAGAEIATTAVVAVTGFTFAMHVLDASAKNANRFSSRLHKTTIKMRVGIADWIRPLPTAEGATDHPTAQPAAKPSTTTGDDLAAVA